MQRRINFTQKFVKEVSAPSTGRLYFHDAKTPHLALCITAAGSRTYYRTGRVNGKPSRVRLGTIDELTVDGARRACSEITGKVAAGNDPMEPKRKKDRTLGELWQWYFDHHSKPHKDTWQQDERRWNRVYAGWSNRKLSSILTEDVQQRITEVGGAQGPYAGNKARELLRHMFATAIEIGWTDRNPVTAVRRFKTKTRERYLQPNEMARFFAALEDSRQPSKDFIGLCLFTGARRGNVGSMQWEHIDLDAGIWAIPGELVKTEEPLVVVLPSPALAILQRRRLIRGPSPFVFPSHSSMGHYRWPKTAWESLLRRAQLQDIRIHDLRRTLGSWQASGNVPLNIIGKSLGHRSIATTQIYARLQVEPVRAAVEAATAAMLLAANNSDAIEKNIENATKPERLRNEPGTKRKSPQL